MQLAAPRKKGMILKITEDKASFALTHKAIEIIQIPTTNGVTCKNVSISSSHVLHHKERQVRTLQMQHYQNYQRTERSHDKPT